MRDNFWRQNITLHVLAALLAIAFWSYVKTADLSARPETSLNIEHIPLEIRDIPAGLHIMNEIPQTVNVQLRGNSSIIEQVLKENLLAYISLNNASEGDGQYAIKVIHPQGLNATATPGRLEVRLERELTADFDLHIKGLEADDPAFAVSAIADPAFVKVSGIRSQFERVSQAIVTVNLASIKQSSKLQLPVKLLDTKGNEVIGLVIEPGVVEVDVKRLPGKLLPVVADLGQPPAGYLLESSLLEPESVYVYGEATVLETLEFIATEPINLDNITKDTDLTVKLILPQKVESCSHQEIKVKLQISEL